MGQHKCFRMGFFCFFYFFGIHKFVNDAEAFVIDEVFFRYLFCDKMGQVSVRDEEDVFIGECFYDLYGVCGGYTDIGEFF